MGVSKRPPAGGDRDGAPPAGGQDDDAAGGAPVRELIRAALADTDPDGPVRWQAITRLQARSDLETFTVARRLCASGTSAERILGADILGELGRDRPFRDRALPVLRHLAANEADPRVLYSVLIAFGHLRDTRALPSVVDLAAHEHPTVRYGAAYALPHVMGDPPDPAGLAALRSLAADADEDVADWAALGLSLNGLAVQGPRPGGSTLSSSTPSSSTPSGEVDDLGRQILDP